MSNFIRLYLVPVTPNSPQQVIDVDSLDLVLSDGVFMPVQVAPTITLVGMSVTSDFTPFDASGLGVALTGTPTQEIRVCFREPVGTDDFPNDAVIIEPDPTNGECVCGLTCNGTQIAYAQVQNVLVPV